MNDKNNKRGLFIVWKKYQRRPEVLAPLTNCQISFLPHLFKSKILRPLDYLLKLINNLGYIWQHKPDFIIAQCPPNYSVLSALITGTPYIIDAHNPLFQVDTWRKLPLAKYLIRKARAIVVHNTEIEQVAKQMYPEAELFNISDPIAYIAPVKDRSRQEKQILVISSFDPWDEPVELLIKTISKLPEYTFMVTADAGKLPLELSDRLQKMDNVRLTGFLPTAEYHALLRSSLAALVLTTSDATQPSGACEALSSDTQLVISKTSLTERLFGKWAMLVDNSEKAIAEAIRSLSVAELDLQTERKSWNRAVEAEIARLNEYISKF